MDSERSGDAISAEQFSVEELRRAVFEGSQRLTKPLALALLARKDYPEKIQDLRRVLTSSNQPAKVRQSAAVELGRIDKGEAREALVGVLEKQERDPLVLRGVLSALQMAGGREGIEALRQRVGNMPESVNRRAAWTATALAYRLGVEGFEIEPVGQLIKLERERAQPIKLNPVDPGLADKVIADVRQTLPALELSHTRAAAIECQGQTLMLLLNREMESARTLELMSRRKMQVGVLATFEGVEGDNWSPRFHIFTQPARKGADKDRVELLITTENGTLVFAGSAEIRGEEVIFALATVDQPGAQAVEITGTYRDDQVRFESALAEEERRARLMPTARKR
jgi:hypothetical protein